LAKLVPEGLRNVTPTDADGGPVRHAVPVRGCGGGVSREHPFPKYMLELIDDVSAVCGSRAN
jgi:hypothetical protein